jgi:hypothetical protein
LSVLLIVLSEEERQYIEEDKKYIGEQTIH